MQIAQAKNAPKEIMHSPALILQWIAQMPPKWLIIFDNADGDYSVVEKFLPPGGTGNILITSRNGELKRLALNSVNVLAMEEDEAVTLFLKSAMLDGTCDGVRNMAKKMVLELSGIPLALDQAGAYIYRSGCGIDGYLKLYQKNKQKLMSRKDFKGASDYGRSAYGTWDISFQQIEQMALKENGEDAEAAHTAISLLRIFAFLNCENIPEELFENAAENYMNDEVDTANSDFPMTLLNHQTLFMDEDGEWDGMQFLGGIQVLLSFSLISAMNHLYSMHLLVNSWSRSRISQTDISEHYHRARALLSCSVVPGWYSDSHAFCRLLAPHIRSNLVHGQELGLQEKYYGHEYDRFAIVFDHIGSWNEEEKVLTADVKEKKEMLGSDHTSTLNAMRNLAFTYYNQRRCAEAEKLQVEVMEAWKIKLGSDNPDVGIIGDLALTYCDQGRWDEAEKLQVERMEAVKVQQGLDHRDTLTAMSNLASTYNMQGRWDKAERLQVEVVKGRKIKLGSDHPDTLTVMGQLASTYGNWERWGEAVKLQVEVIKAWKVKMGSDHQETLVAMNNLGLIYWKQGKWDKAEKLQVEVMKAWKEKLGADHPRTLTTMGNLALTYHNQGKWDEAEKLQVEVVKGQKVQRGSEHPDTLTAMNNLATMYLKQGRLDEAEILQVEVVDKRIAKLGLHHPNTLITLNNLASTYQKKGRSNDAEKLQVEVMSIRKAKLGLVHPHTLTTMHDLSLTYHSQGRWDEAEKLQVEVMDARKVKLGSEHPDTLQVMADLALTYKSQKMLNEAESLLSDAIQAMQKAMGSEHYTTDHYKQELDKLLKAKHDNQLSTCNIM
jgi:tetratricopeptide (TPR) repeat protein